MQELSGSAPQGDGEEQRRIEGGGNEGYDQGDSRPERELKPWQRGPTGAAAPWQRRDDRPHDDHSHGRDQGSAPPWAAGGRGDRGDRGDRHGRSGDRYGGYNMDNAEGGYGGAPGAAPAPWQQYAAPPPPGGQTGYGYGGYPPSYPPQASMGPPPGMPPPPPGMGQMFPGYPGANPPPPPPPSEGPPPPVSFVLFCFFK